MREPRLGDDVDDFCVRCKRIMNHAIVSVVNGEPAKVRCRTCHNDHDYRHEQAPPPKVDLRKQALFNEALKKINPAAAAEAEAVADVEIETDNLAPDLMLDEAVPGLDPELDADSAPAEEPAPEPAPRKAPVKAKPRGRKSAK
jgi:hypothetical protein